MWNTENGWTSVFAARTDIQLIFPNDAATTATTTRVGVKLFSSAVVETPMKKGTVTIYV